MIEVNKNDCCQRKRLKSLKPMFIYKKIVEKFKDDINLTSMYIIKSVM